MFGLRQHSRFLALWSLVFGGALMANPLAPFSWVELVAVLGPLVMAVDRRIWREAALAIGVPVITLLWLADGDGESVLRLVVAWVGYGVGVALIARVLDAQVELESVAGNVAFELPAPEGLASFELALDRELARSRRHERPFALVSAAADPYSLETRLGPDRRSTLLKNLGAGRARLELRDFLKDELHVYAEVVATPDRVLALVPEVEPRDVEALLARLRQAAAERLDFALQIGASRFPQEAVCAAELISAADRDRSVSRLTPLPDEPGDSREADSGEPPALAPDGPA